MMPPLILGAVLVRGDRRSEHTVIYLCCFFKGELSWRVSVLLTNTTPRLVLIPGCRSCSPTCTACSEVKRWPRKGTFWFVEYYLSFVFLFSFFFLTLKQMLFNFEINKKFNSCCFISSYFLIQLKDMCDTT